MEEINIKEFLGYVKEKILYVIIAVLLTVITVILNFKKLENNKRKDEL